MSTYGSGVYGAGLFGEGDAVTVVGGTATTVGAAQAGAAVVALAVAGGTATTVGEALPGTVWVTVRKNLMRTPSAEQGAFSTGTGDGTLQRSQSADRAWHGTKSIKVEHLTGTPNNLFTLTQPLSVPTGTTVTFKVRGYFPSSNVSVFDRMRTIFRDDAAGINYSTISTVAPVTAFAEDQWVEFKVTHTVPPGTTLSRLYWRFMSVAPKTIGDAVYYDGFQSDDEPYFDGDTPDTATERYSWLGVAGNSESIMEATAKVVAGGVATTVGAALPGTVTVAIAVAGGTASEVSQANAGSVAQALLVVGGTAGETHSANAGVTFAALLVTGGTAAEVDTAHAGVVDQVTPVYNLDFEDFTLGPLVESELRAALDVAIPSNGYYDCVDIVSSGGSKQFQVTIPAGAVGSNGGADGTAIIYPLPEPLGQISYFFDFTWPAGVPFGLGGKITGFGGAESGNPPSGGSGPFYDGWSLRWNWDVGGELIGYAYHPDQPHEFGDGLHTGYYLTPGEQVRLGITADIATGAVRYLADGEPIYETTLDLLGIPATHFLMSVFRGGSGSSWAVDEDTPLLFDNLLLAGGLLEGGGGEDEDAVPPQPYLGVADYQIDVAPGTIEITIEGGEPDDYVQVKVDGVSTQLLRLSSDGSLRGVSIEIPEGLDAGPHTVAINSTTLLRGHLVAVFDVLVLTDALPPVTPPAPDALPVAVPEAVVAGTDVQRWVLQDLAPGGLGSWILPANPRTMDPLPFERTLTAERTADPDGLIHVTEASGRTAEWGFAGYYKTEDFQVQLAAYAELRRRLYLIDHRNRAWMITFSDLNMTPRKRTLDGGTFNDQTGDYDARVIIYGTYQEPT